MLPADEVRGPLIPTDPGPFPIFRAAGRAQVEAWVEEDPWTANGVLVTDLIAPWDVRIGQLLGR